MEIISDSHKMYQWVQKRKTESKTVGLVPTMGFLHKGHLSLVDVCKKKSDIVVMSIYVNPMQFGPSEDYNVYPRDIERDKELARKSGVDVLFFPDDDIMGVRENYTYVSVEKITENLCGKSRPGHFRGVTTIVTKLFNIVDPDISVFGQKDAQQLAVIRRMVKDLNFSVNIIGSDIVREHDGLAMSSRNVFLSKEQRMQATVLYSSLKHVKTLYDNGEKNTAKLKDVIEKEIKNNAPLAKVDYISIVDKENMSDIDYIKDDVGANILIAVFFGKVRLIDNIII